jgi:phospholipase/lecithinase/hemolysin
VAAAYGLAALCPVYKFNGASFVANPKPGCTSFAVGGGRINASKVADPGMPSSIIRQLQDGAAAGWSKTDLLLIDGGGNDAADLVTLFMNVNDDKVYNDYLRLLASKVPAAELEEALAGENGLVDAATLYMQRLADGFVADVRALTLDKGAQQVVVANMPAIVYTPRFQAVLDQVGMATGPETRARLEALVNGWVGAFNQRLAEGFAGERRVRVVDLASRFTDQVRNPAKYGLSNVSLPVCGDEWPRPVPRRSFDECTAAALSDTPPPEGGPTGTSWWERYMFADSFHPTPYGHALLGDLVLDALDDANWL